MPNLDALFSPFQIKGMTVKNRSVCSAMVTDFNSPMGDITETFMAYHEQKAKGGYGLIITENYMVAPFVGGMPFLAGLYKDEHIEQNKVFTERIHKHGAKIIAQIYHSGYQCCSPLTIKKAPVSASAMKGMFGMMTKELTISEIKDIEDCFARAATIAKKAGFDGVEIHGAHGYLISDFLSSYTNKRSDQYGGSVYNRARFAIEIVEKVRAAVGKDFPIFFRINSIEYAQGGVGIEESKAVCRLLVEAGVDVIDCSQKGKDKDEYGIALAIAGRGFWLDNAEEIKKAVDVPVIGVARVNDPFIANEALVSEKCDLIIMARASLADPANINKAKEGRIDEIRYCIGCDQGCAGEVGKLAQMRCLVNPLIGHDHEYSLEKVDTPKKVLVVGGGVSGAEAAYVAATKGHEVTLVEKADRLGGQWLTASKPIGKTEFNTFVFWQETALNKLGVKILKNTTMTKDMLDEIKPDVVVVATGSNPIIPNIEGIDQTRVVKAEDVLDGKVAPGKNVVVVGGGQTGRETADFLSYNYDSKVTIVEMLPQLKMAGPGARYAEMFLMRRMKERNVDILTNTSLQKVTDTTVELLNNGTSKILENIDQVVLAIGVRKDESCKDLLEGFTGQVLYVGDAKEVKNGYLNIREGFETALSI